MVEDPSRKAHMAMVKYPDKVPVYISVAPGEQSVPDLDRRYYLMSSKMAIFVFVDNGILPPTSALISEIYSQYKNPIDALLYISYRSEQTFG